MSSALSTIITDVTNHGVQSGARYSASIGGWDVPSSYIISASVPGPKFEILNINYWEANMYTRYPVGVKIEDPIILNMLIPTSSILDTSLANYMDKFSQMNSGKYFGAGSDIKYFIGEKNGGNNGIQISITTYDRSDVATGTYLYNNCYLERILPLKFAADEPQPVYATFVFAVGYMAQST